MGPNNPGSFMGGNGIGSALQAAMQQRQQGASPLNVNSSNPQAVMPASPPPATTNAVPSAGAAVNPSAGGQMPEPQPSNSLHAQSPMAEQNAGAIIAAMTSYLKAITKPSL